MVVVCVQLHGEMTNGNDVTQNTKHTNLFYKKKLLYTLLLQPTCQQVYNILYFCLPSCFEIVLPTSFALNKKF
jgi:hypothetical protein